MTSVFLLVCLQGLGDLPARLIHVLQNCILQMELSRGRDKVSASENKVIHGQDKSVQYHRPQSFICLEAVQNSFVTVIFPWWQVSSGVHLCASQGEMVRACPQPTGRHPCCFTTATPRSRRCGGTCKSSGKNI